MRKIREFRIGSLYFRRPTVWEEAMTYMLKTRLEKAKIGGNAAKKKLIDGIAQIRRGASNLSELEFELQRTFKEATDWLAIKGVDIRSVLETGKSIKM
jgi:hypothetical protein